ncbi:diacylglycerol kinase family lipid kinase [Colidextribacter sp. OB.20]|uniref:diacylglycerol/lipid kinase family protein n=1 Tax=Colidextribacter sp. OB.20 TaxID=2304568 RepID=UPI00136B9742|nr:diacylglycerol kinase family protein [Colidextribacter sp. OB.20]NBI09659.1 diacylglycerol kinase family lipid kinase [Colidextribacter sp. OB.20]
MNRLLFIYNPTSGTGQVKSALASVLDVFTKSGWIVTSYPTQCAGDGTRAVRELGAQFDRIVCAGGDGTLSEVAAGLMELDSPPPLGYVPFGSTNDCAATLHLPKKPVEAALVAAGTGVPFPMDIGQLNGRPFIYVAAFGAFTKVAYDTPQELKNTFGHLAYIFAGIASLPTIAPYRMKVEYDGQSLEDDFYFGMVSNAQSIGGIKPPKVERVVLDDGLFEVTLVKKPINLADLADGLQALTNPAADRSGALVQFQARTLTFTAQQPVSWTVDGEFGGDQPVNRVVNRQKALQIIRAK